MALLSATASEPATPLALLGKRQRLDRIFDETWLAASSYETRWSLVGQYIRPTRYRWWDSDADRGDRSFDKILDSTAPHSSNIARSGMLAGLANPARPWFMFALDDKDPDPPLSIVQWLTDVRDITLDVMRRSNFYTAFESALGDDIDFATGTLGIYEDPVKVIRCHDFPIGSYRLANDSAGRNNVFARKVMMTVSQVVRLFGEERCSERVKNAWRTGSHQQKVIVRHLVAPNDDGSADGLFATQFPWKECYWEEGRDGEGFPADAAERVLGESGYHENPIIASRWMRSDEDSHGVMSPGILALPFVRRLFAMERTGLNALEKMVDPPLRAPTSMKNRPISLQSGAITYYDVLQGSEGPEAMHQVNMHLDHLWAKQAEARAAVESIYMVELFLGMIGDARSQRPTAEEVRARMREKLQALGPVLERKSDETLGPAIERIVAIEMRASRGAWESGKDGLLPMPPREIQGRTWRVEYISEVAQAQKLIGLDGLERYLTFGIQTAANTGDPTVLDNIDFDDAMKHYADMVGVNPTVRRSGDERDAIRAKRAQDAAIAQSVAAMPEMAGAAKDLAKAKTDEPSVLNNILQRAAQ